MGKEIETYHSPSSASYHMAQENVMLQQMNKDCFSRINSLESRIKDLARENDVLMKRISESFREKEEGLQSAFSKFFQGGKINPLAASQLGPENLEKIKAMVNEGINYPFFYDKLHPHSREVAGYSALSRETSLQSDGGSTMDSYMSGYPSMKSNSQTFNPTETRSAESSAFVATTQHTRQHSDLTYLPFPYNGEDASILGKRKLHHYQMASPSASPLIYSKAMRSEETYLGYEEPHKLTCYGVFDEAEEPKINLMDFNQPLFVGGKAEERA